jgi:hypothetical protein
MSRVWPTSKLLSACGITDSHQKTRMLQRDNRRSRRYGLGLGLAQTLLCMGGKEDVWVEMRCFDSHDFIAFLSFKLVLPRELKK